MSWSETTWEEKNWSENVFWRKTITKLWYILLAAMSSSFTLTLKGYEKEKILKGFVKNKFKESYIYEWLFWEKVNIVLFNDSFQ